MEWDQAVDGVRVRAARRKLAMGMYDEPEVIAATCARVQRALHSTETQPFTPVEIITPASDIEATTRKEVHHDLLDRRCRLVEPVPGRVHRPDPGLIRGGQGRTANATAVAAAVVCAALLLGALFYVAILTLHAAGWLR